MEIKIAINVKSNDEFYDVLKKLDGSPTKVTLPCTIKNGRWCININGQCKGSTETYKQLGFEIISYKQFLDAIEVNSDKIVLLLPKNNERSIIVKDNIEYKLDNYNGRFELDILNNNTSSYTSIGLKTKEDFIFYKPVLDVLNIEIKEEYIKYKIDSEIEYTEEEIKKFKKLGLKFKKID